MATPGTPNSRTPLRSGDGEGRGPPVYQSTPVVGQLKASSVSPPRSTIPLEDPRRPLADLAAQRVTQQQPQPQLQPVKSQTPSYVPQVFRSSYGDPVKEVVQSQTQSQTPSYLTRRDAPSYGEPVKERSRLEEVAPYVCEFVGTFMFTFIVAICSLSPGSQWRPTAIGLSLVVITYAVGFVSGGHLNPAVSLAFLLARKMKPCKCLCYMILQIAAGMLGAFFFELVFLTHAPPVTAVAPFTFTQASIIELLFTTMLCFVFLNVAAATRNNPDHDKNQFFPLAVGFTVIAAGYACGNISGGLLNPAVVFALDVSGGYIRGGLLFPLMELLGGVLAALLFRMCRSEDYQGSSVPVDVIASHVPSLAARMLSEFVGTFFVVLTFGLSVIMMSMSAAWCVGAALLSMVYALGNVSGGHFNPAVTAAVCFSGRNKMHRNEVAYYWLAQLLGGVIAGTLMRYIHYHGPTYNLEFNVGGQSDSLYHWGSMNETFVGSQRNGTEHFGFVNSTTVGGQSDGAYHWGTVVTVEILFTALLTYTVLCVATCEEYVVSTRHSRQNFYWAMAVGFAMCVGIFAAGPVSGGYMNPAVVMAFAVETVPRMAAAPTIQGWPNWTQPILAGISILCKYIGFFSTWMLYFVFELIGALLAAGAFRLTHPAEYREKPYSPLIHYVQYPVSGADYS